MAERGFDYNGLDIAEGPVAMVRDRIGRLGFDDVEGRVRRARSSRRRTPTRASTASSRSGACTTPATCRERSTRSTGSSSPEARRHGDGLPPPLLPAAKQWIDAKRGRGLDDEQVRASYDHDSTGAAAPATEYAGRLEAKRKLFGSFSKVRTSTQNFDYMTWKRGKRKYQAIDRDKLLRGPARIAGLDLYVKATK